MRRSLAVVVLAMMVGCSGSEPADQTTWATAPLSQTQTAALRDELLALKADDQRYEQMVIQQDPAIRDPGFYDEKARLQVARADRCQEIFDAIGFPGHDLVGEQASHAFWLIVQHADHDPEFQDTVATAMTIAHQQGNADGKQLAYLTDRVRVNTDRPQLYGTQVQHDIETGKVSPRPLERPAEVDALRAEVGLEPLWSYMNGHCELFFAMNASVMAEHGVTEAHQYEVGFSDW
ncbi:MAG: DUF6624 domain-containing protein [Planctomycetota bacterium]